MTEASTNAAAEATSEPGALLVERIRIGLWIILCGPAVFLLTGLGRAGPEIPGLRFLQFPQTVSALAFLVLLRRLPAFRRNPRRVALLTVAMVSSTSAMQAIGTADVETAPVLLGVLVIGTAAMLPWGIREQLATASMVILAGLGHAVSMHETLAAQGYAPTVGLVVAALVSLYVTIEGERNRRIVARQTEELAGRNQELRAEIAQRLGAEDDLRQSELRHRIVSDVISDFAYAFRMDANGRLSLEWMTDAFTRLSGYTPQEAEQVGWENLLHPDDLAIAHKRGAALLAGKIDTTEYRLITKSGAVRWVRDIGRAVTGEDGISRVYGGAQDITGRKHAEEALESQAAREALITGISTRFANALPEQIEEEISLALDEVARFLAADRALVGIRPEAIGTQDWLREWPSEQPMAQTPTPVTDRSHDFTWWDEMLSRRAILNLRSVSDLPADMALDRAAILQRGIKSVLGIPLACAGVVTGFLVMTAEETERTWAADSVALLQIVADIFANAVERRRAHLLLQRRELYFRSLIEHGSDIITVVTGGNITYCSPSVERVLGHTPEELAGGDAYLLCHPDDVPLLRDALFTAAEENGGVTRSVDVRVRHKDGTWRTVEVLGKPLLGTDRSGFIINARDVTQRKELERLKDELVSTVSHELRTPLTSLRGFVELLLKRDFDRQHQREFLGIVHDETMRLSRLIDDFLDVQKIESGREKYDFQSLPPADMIEESVALFGQNGDVRHWELELQDELPPVRADHDRIRQVLANLLSNAVKFSPEGSDIRVGARECGDEVIFWVADQGIGIPQTSLPSLFQKFSRVDNQETRRIGGTGLGLVLVKEIVAAHQGRVWVETEEGVGSSFFFALPIADTPSVATANVLGAIFAEDGNHATVQ